MAFAATETRSKSFSLSGAFDAVISLFVHIAESNGRMQAVEKLNRMSDAELAERGLKREDIVRHVFRDLYYV